jgi:hypothetical protein
MAEPRRIMRNVGGGAHNSRQQQLRRATNALDQHHNMSQTSRVMFAFHKAAFAGYLLSEVYLVPLFLLRWVAWQFIGLMQVPPQWLLCIWLSFN